MQEVTGKDIGKVSFMVCDSALSENNYRPELERGCVNIIPTDSIEKLIEQNADFEPRIKDSLLRYNLAILTSDDGTSVMAFINDYRKNVGFNYAVKGSCMALASLLPICFYGYVESIHDRETVHELSRRLYREIYCQGSGGRNLWKK